MTPIARPLATETEGPKNFQAPESALHAMGSHEKDFAAAMERASAERNSSRERIESPREKTPEAEHHNSIDRSTAHKPAQSREQAATNHSEHASVTLRRAAMRDSSGQPAERNVTRNRPKTEPSTESQQTPSQQPVTTKAPVAPKQDSSTSQSAGDDQRETASDDDNKNDAGTDGNNPQDQGAKGGDQSTSGAQCVETLGSPSLTAATTTSNTDTGNTKGPQASPATQASTPNGPQTGNQVQDSNDSGMILPDASASDPSNIPNSNSNTSAPGTPASQPSEAKASHAAKLQSAATLQAIKNQQVEQAAPLLAPAKPKALAPLHGAGTLSQLPPGPDGTPAAFTTGEMKWSSEQNKFAEFAPEKDANEQDLTGNGGSDAPSGISFPAGFAGDKTFEMFANAPAIIVSPAYGLSKGQLDSIGSTGLPARIEQIHGTINREVVTIRQSGADSMAVALKVDSHTDLLLQLTNRDGQIQAAVRCERGDLSALNGHWTQLQESLAKQNIHLMPLEDRTASSGGSSASENTQDSNGQKSSRNGQSDPEDDAQKLLPNVRAITPAVNTSKSRKSSPKGFESWA